MYYTKRELIIQWLLKYPNEACCLDLTHNAIAGHVETKQGFIWWSDYQVTKGI